MGFSPFFFRRKENIMLNRGLDKQELLRIVDSVANEKSIDKELILSSMEMAIQRAAYNKFGFENSIEATINRENGSIKIHKVLEVFAILHSGIFLLVLFVLFVVSVVIRLFSMVCHQSLLPILGLPTASVIF